jgi:hypothetical protein
MARGIHNALVVLMRVTRWKPAGGAGLGTPRVRPARRAARRTRHDDDDGAFVRQDHPIRTG